MGSGLFKKPKTKTKSTLSPEQQDLSQLLSQFFLNHMGGSGNLSLLMQELMSSTSPQSKEMSERMFTDALLKPSMAGFHGEVSGRMNQSFGNYGGSLGDRRQSTVSQGEQRTRSDVDSLISSILPQVHSFPLQQSLTRLQGAGAYNSMNVNSAALASAFALAPTSTLYQQQAGPGWEFAGTFAQTAGAAIGSIWGPVGGMIGQQVGDQIGQGIQSFGYS